MKIFIESNTEFFYDTSFNDYSDDILRNYYLPLFKELSTKYFEKICVRYNINPFIDIPEDRMMNIKYDIANIMGNIAKELNDLHIRVGIHYVPYKAFEIRIYLALDNFALNDHKNVVYFNVDMFSHWQTRKIKMYDKMS